MYKIFLAESESMEYIGDITNIARSKSLDVALNRPGSFSFQVNLNNNLASQMVAVKNCIIVEKNGEPVWSGPIWNKNKDYSTEQMAISCVGWFEILNKRLLDAPMTFTDETDGDIAFSLLDYANSQEVESIVYPTWITEGTNASTSTRTIQYEQMQSVGQEIQSLTDIESGFDYTIDPLTRIMDIHSWDDYTTLELTWGYDWGPQNLLNVTVEERADAMGNQQYFVGTVGVAEVHDDTSLAFHGQLFQQVNNLTEVTTLDILGAYASAELEVKKNPQVVYTVSPKIFDGANNVPSVFEDYQLGDQMNLTAKSSGAEAIEDQAIRIFGVSISIDELGNENIGNLQVTYQQGQ